MDGYEVETIDGDKIGHVVGTDHGYLLVEHGLRKTKHALPHSFAEVDDDTHVVRTTLSKQIVHDSPKVDGEIDREAVAQHYGLEGFTDPPTRGREEVLPDDPALGVFNGGDRSKNYPGD